MSGFGAFDGNFWFIWLVVVAVNVLVWGGLILLIVLGIRWLLRANRNDRYQPGAASGEDTALAVLRERYARGEIDAAEFEERKRTLGG